MHRQPSSQLDRIAGMMQWFCLGVLAFVFIGYAGISIQTLTDPARVAYYFHAHDTTLYPDQITRTQIVLFILLMWVSLLLKGYGLYALWGMFGAFRNGAVISVNAASQMRKAGGAFLAAAIWSVPSDTLTTLVLTASNPVGERIFGIGIGTEQLYPLLLPGVLFAIGHVMKAAADIDTENRGFV